MGHDHLVMINSSSRHDPALYELAKRAAPGAKTVVLKTATFFALDVLLFLDCLGIMGMDWGCRLSVSVSYCFDDVFWGISGDGGL